MPTRSPQRNTRSKGRAGRTFYGTSGGGGGGGASDPSGMTGKVLWIRGKDLAGSSGSAVTAITDQSGAGNNLTGNNTKVGTTSATSSGKYFQCEDATFTSTLYPDLGLAGISAIGVLANSFTSGYDNDGATTGNYWHNNGESNPWIERNFQTATVITQYTIQPDPGNQGKTPDAWTIHGSNDRSSYTLLDTRSGISWVNGVNQTFTFSNSTAYKFYKMTRTTAGAFAMGEWTFGGVTNGIGDGERWVVIKSVLGFQSWIYGNSGSNNSYPTTGTWVDDFGMNSQQTMTPPAALTSWRLYRTAISAASFDAWIDNTSVKSVSTPSRMWPNQVKPMSRLYANVAEDLVFNRRLTSGEAASLIAYFNTEHGLTVT